MIPTCSRNPTIKLSSAIAFLFLLLSLPSIAQLKTGEGKRKINGTNLFLTVRGKGEPLLVIHGGPGLNHRYFIPHLAGLEKNFTLIYYDQRACGLSDIPSTDSISIKFLADDIDFIRKELKIEKLNILAHSWGAVLAAHYSLLYPGHVKRLILSNPSPFSREYDEQSAALIKQRTTQQDSTERATIIGKGNLDTGDYERLFQLGFRPSAFRPSNIALLKLDLPARFPETISALFTALSKDKLFQVNLYDEVKAFRFPVLIIHGKSDVLPMAAVDRLKKEIVQAEVVIFERSGHFPFVEETALFEDVVSRFLRK